MTVDAAGDLQTRYARISDRFKATWTAHQFATGVFSQILGEEPGHRLTGLVASPAGRHGKRHVHAKR